jgi:hypothetical protein
VNNFLAQIADLLRVRNEADRSIATLLGRPATSGNIGEAVAARVFGIRLVESGSNRGFDGVFSDGPHAGKTVNIKTYSRHESILDIGPHPCDYFLVLTGPVGPARHLPWGIDSIFLFESITLLEALKRRQVKIGVATSVLKADWEAARLYPPSQNSPMRLSEAQLAMLALFAPDRLP